MDLEQRLRAGLAAPDPGPTFTARVMARLGRKSARRRSSVILMGTVLVVAAAAAMWAWRIADVSSQPDEIDAVVATSDSAQFTEDAAVQVVADSSAPAGPAPEEPLPMDDAPPFSVLVMPLRHDAEEPGKRRPVEALYAAMIEELRKVPGLSLHETGDVARGGQADYVLTITNLATSLAASGQVSLRSTDGGNTYSVRGSDNGMIGAASQGINLRPIDAAGTASGSAAASYGAGAMTGVVNLVLNNRLAGVDIDYTHEIRDGGRIFSGGSGSMSSVYIGDRVVGFSGGSLRSPQSMAWVEIKVEPQQKAASRYTFPMVDEGPVGEQLCSGAGAARPPECMTPAQLAAEQVAKLRLQLFPADGEFQQRVMARLGGAGQDADKVLLDLLPLVTVEGGARLSAASLQALFSYVARQPVLVRANVWRTLGNVTHPALVAPMVEALRLDPDRNVRLAVLAIVEENFLADPAARNALESIDRGDPDAVVRAAVRWVLYGEGQWRSDLMAALQDTGLPYEARVAPLAARASARHTLQMLQLRRAVLQEEQIRDPLMTLVRENMRDATHAQTTGELLGLLGNVDDSAVFELFLQLMREPSLPMPVSSAVSSWALNHLGDPRVRESLPTAQVVIPSALVERMGEVSRQAPLLAPPPTDLTVIQQ